MSQRHPAADLQMIPLDQIVVLNPRDRNGKVFEEIIGNIKSLGLKKPVTVTPRSNLNNGKRYLLICGEGRLKAYKALQETCCAPKDWIPCRRIWRIVSGREAIRHEFAPVGVHS